jgi:hypothetical protein
LVVSVTVSGCWASWLLSIGTGEVCIADEHAIGSLLGGSTVKAACWVCSILSIAERSLMDGIVEPGVIKDC